MDPLNAIGLASTIVQFVDFGWKIAKETKDVYESAAGATLENENIEFTVGQLQSLTDQLASRTASFLKGSHDEALLSLAKRCREISGELLKLLTDVKAKHAKSEKDSKSKWQSFIAAVRAELKKGKKVELLARLQECRQQLGLQLQFIARYGIFHFVCTTLSFVLTQHVEWI
jgi:hypothetical protein